MTRPIMPTNQLRFGASAGHARPRHGCAHVTNASCHETNACMIGVQESKARRGSCIRQTCKMSRHGHRFVTKVDKLKIINTLHDCASFLTCCESWHCSAAITTNFPPSVFKVGTAGPDRLSTLPLDLFLHFGAHAVRHVPRPSLNLSVLAHQPITCTGNAKQTYLFPLPQWN
jgi:hypothetical protein